MIRWFTISVFMSKGNLQNEWYKNHLPAGLDEKDMNVNRDFSNCRNREKK